jgi:hypothetical protein
MATACRKIVANSRFPPLPAPVLVGVLILMRSPGLGATAAQADSRPL